MAFDPAQHIGSARIAMEKYNPEDMGVFSRHDMKSVPAMASDIARIFQVLRDKIEHELPVKEMDTPSSISVAAADAIATSARTMAALAAHLPNEVLRELAPRLATFESPRHGEHKWNVNGG